MTRETSWVAIRPDGVETTRLAASDTTIKATSPAKPRLSDLRRIRCTAGRTREICQKRTTGSPTDTDHTSNAPSKAAKPTGVPAALRSVIVARAIVAKAV